MHPIDILAIAAAAKKEAGKAVVEAMPKIAEIVQSAVEAKEIKTIADTAITIKGDKGDKGDQGPKGDQGDVGPKGDTGDIGPKGDKGYPGRNGNDGKDGRNGKDGKPGRDGKDGTSVSEVAIGNDGNLYVGLSDGKVINAGKARGDDGKPGKDGKTIIGGGGSSRSGGGASWGGITGTLSEQSDLQLTLNGKATAAQGALADTAMQPGDSIPTSNVTGLDAALAGKAPLSAAVPIGALLWRASVGVAAFTAIGGAVPTAVGTATAASIAVTNIHTRTPRVDYLVTVAATNAVAGFRGTATMVTVGASSANMGGFDFTCRWGPATGVATATNRAFVGLGSVTSAPTDVEPSTLLSIVGMGWDAADANVQIMHNDASGAATKINLGNGFPVPTVDRTNLYELSMSSPKGTTQQVDYAVTNINTGEIVTGSITTNLPTNTTLLAPRGWMSAGGTSSVIGLALSSLICDPLL